MPIYSANKGAFSLTTSTTVLLELATTSTCRAKLVQWSFMCNGTTAANAPIQLQILRATASATGAGSVTPTKFDDYAPTALTTAEYGATAGGTAGDILEEFYVSPTSGIFIQYPLGREIQIPVSGFLWMRAVSPANAVTVSSNMVWEE